MLHGSISTSYDHALNRYSLWVSYYLFVLRTGIYSLW